VRDIFYINSQGSDSSKILRVNDFYGDKNPLCPDQDAIHLPTIDNINYVNFTGSNSALPSIEFLGINEKPITNLNMKNVFISLPSNDTDKAYNCTAVSGTAQNVVPPACKNLDTEVVLIE